MAAQLRTDGLVDAERLRQTLHLLRDAGPKGITKNQLSRKLGSVSPRTVDRAIKLLEEQGARIGKQRAGRPSVIHFTLEKGPTWDEQVSGEARLALRFAAMSLSHSGALLWNEKLTALETLTGEHLSTKARQAFAQLRKALNVVGGTENPVETPEVLESILRALEGERELEVEYQSVGTRKAAPMNVLPFALTHDLFSGGAFLLVWEPKRGLPLHLRLGRIHRAKVLPRVAAIPDPLLMEHVARHQIGGSISTELPFLVKARMEGAHWLQALKEAPPILPDFETFPQGDAVEVRFKANHTAGATRWLLQFGEAIEVLEPAWLRSEIAQRLNAAAAKYRKRG